MTTGVGWSLGRCLGNIPPVEPVDGRGWPGLCLEVRLNLSYHPDGNISDVKIELQDSPLGVRDTDFVTAFPAGLTAAST